MNKLTPQEVEATLKKAGISVTIQRLALVSFILNADHPTAEDVINWAKNNLSKVNVATVYNTLNTLEEASIIKKVKFPHLTQHVYDHNVSHHFHFLDEESGKILDLDPNHVHVSHNLKDWNISEVEVLLKGKKKTT